MAPNYRLGPFGFLAHTALATEDPHGTAHPATTASWINGPRSGGCTTPSLSSAEILHNVTLAGTSAGGQSVGLHLVSPASEGLLSRAIIQSAYPTSGWRSVAEGAAQGDAFAAALGCTDPSQVVACMRSTSLDAVLTALSQALQQVVEPANRTFWEPVVDGVVIPDQPRILFGQGASTAYRPLSDSLATRDGVRSSLAAFRLA